MANNQGGPVDRAVSGTEPEPTQSTGLLDTASHNAYVSGCTTTTFAPTGTLTRAKAAQMSL